jgi:hypothetical protein
MNTKLTVATLAIAWIAGTLSGCAKLNPEQGMFGGGRVTTASANQIFDPGFEGFSDEQLLQLLDPENKAQGAAGKQYQELTESEKIAQLRKSFRVANEDAVYKEAHRAQIQDRLIAASNQRCNLFTTYLKRISTYNNGIFGTLTTILGGAGAIVTGENAARLLSGLAGISSGTRAELNQAIFESVATSVIVPSIHKTRADLLKEILDKREKKAIKDYTIEGAIADAIMYHGACSMDAGIAHAQKSIQAFDDIGVKRFTEIQTSLGIGRSISASFTQGPIASPVVAKKVLDAFAAKLPEYKKKLKDPAKLGNLETAVKDDGTLGKEAIKLDESLKQVLFDYSIATGAQKTDAFRKIDAQQADARTFARKIERADEDLLDAITAQQKP